MAQKVYKIIYYLFFVFIAVVVLVLILSALPNKTGLKTFIVQSGSMEPAIKTGSVVVVKSASNYKIGDIITFGPYSKKKAPTTHRIVEMRAQTGQPVYTTRGDANNATDTREVLAKDVLGKVYFNIPYIGYAVAVAKKPLGFAVLIIIPAAIIVFDEVKKIIAEIKLRRKKKDPNLGLPKEMLPGENRDSSK